MYRRGGKTTGGNTLYVWGEKMTGGNVLGGKTTGGNMS